MQGVRNQGNQAQFSVTHYQVYNSTFVCQFRNSIHQISIMLIFTLFGVVCCFSVQLVCANLANPTIALNLATEAETPPNPTNCTSYPPSAPASEIPHAWKNLTSHPTAPASEIPPAWTNCTSYLTALAIIDSSGCPVGGSDISSVWDWCR